ncbi:MAG: hypothetical protein M0R17_05680 [Candidatus Omnitrophica bacterium]|jgi:hypothetical protein|nr:hypothetical protein [Candidatus Omnitrophota bacterium]
MRNLTKEKYFEAEDLIIQAEQILNFTEMDDESNLLNKLWSYLRLRAKTLDIIK